MSEHPYLAERQTEYWTSREIDNALLDEGWDVVVFPITQLTEHELPADFIFVDKTRSKIFGVQYKALYHNSADHWRLDKDQHARLQKTNWIFYFVSELTSVNQHRQALHYTRIYDPHFKYRGKLFKHKKKNIRQPGYSRWAAFLDKFRSCKIGKVLKSKSDLDELLRAGTSNKLYDCDIKRMLEIYAFNLDLKRVLKITNLSINAFEPDSSALEETDPFEKEYDSVKPDPGKEKG